MRRGTTPSAVHSATDFAVSKPLRSLGTAKARRILDKTSADHSSTADGKRKREQIQAIPHSVPDLSLTNPQVTAHAPLAPRIPVSTSLVPTQKFSGVSKHSASPTEFPPDPNGAVGPSDYVEMVNSVVAVYDKSGSPEGSPASIGSFWNTLGGPCGSSEDGDPVVLYDGTADRWLLSEFSLNLDPSTGVPRGPFYECIAVSKTGNPLRRYNQFAFKISKNILPDYPKLAVWNDAYYMTTNRFDLRTGQFLGTAVSAFERTKMISGDRTAQMIDWKPETVPSLQDRYGMLPASNGGTSAPPAGRHEYVIGSNDDSSGFGTDSLYLYKAVPKWSAPADSRLKKGDSYAVKPFDSVLCSFRTDCIPQKNTTKKVDAVAGGQLMYPFTYRYFDNSIDPFGAYVVNQTVDLGNDRAGVRWYELEDTGSGPALFRQGTVGDTSKNRWLGSISIDKTGDMALGYSASSKRSFPSIRASIGDSTARLGASESILKRGRGSQTASVGRWGDYSSMAVDPNDGCTFWYTNEFYRTSSRFNWHTEVSSFQAPGCLTGIPPEPGTTKLPIDPTPATINVSHLTARPNPFTPNGDGHRDVSKLGFHIDHKAKVTVTIYRHTHRLGRIASGTLPAAGRYYVRWRGRVGGNKLRPDTYRFRVKAVWRHASDQAFHKVTIKRS